MREACKRGPGYAASADQNGKIWDPVSGYDQGRPDSGREAGYNHALKCCRRMGALSRLCSCITIGGLMRNISRRGVCAALSLGALSLAGCQNIANQNEPADNVPTISDSAGTDHAADEPVEEPEDTSSSEPQGTVERLLATMTLEQKVAQLFLVTPEQLTGVSKATVAGSKTERALQEIPVGGLVYFKQNIVETTQTLALISGTRELCCAAGAGIAPFLGVDEEGGPLVARVANSGAFDVEHFPNMADVGASGDPVHAARVGTSIGSYLHEIGFNLDFAPVADVLTNPENTAIGKRSFGSDPDLVAQMVEAEVAAMLETGTLPCVKHFPGHGDTAGDSHTGAVYAERTRDEIESCEFEPFRAAIDAGCPMIMVGHIETPNFAADGLPASLSHVMMHDVLREELGFDGVIISDSFAMGAITENYEPADAAVRFFAAGGDILLMTPDLHAAHQGVLDAIATGSLTEERIDDSVRRVLTVKQQAGIIA